jgi:flagellar basal body-associated protein FliL
MIILAIVASLSTVGGVYGAVFWKTSANAPVNKEEQSKLQTMKTHMISVPILTDGQVLGYVVARLQFTADADLIKASSVQPEAFVADQAFRLIYETTPDDIKKGRKRVFKELSANIISGVNARLGRDVVKDIMIDSWTYLSKQDMMRNNEHAR